MSDRLRFVFCATLLLIFTTACPAPQRKVTPLSKIEQPQPSIWTNEVTAPVAAPVVEFPKTPPPVAVPIVTNAILSGWVPLRNWAAEHALPAPVASFTRASTNGEIRGPTGVFVIDAFRRYARWNGLQVGLGFAPQFSPDGTLMHSIDVAKVLEPLLLTNRAQRLAGGLLVIDPGHGGENLGARARVPNFLEKEMTLDWARRIERLLAGSAWRVALTRTTDADVSLQDRVAFADRAQADLFISLHFNSMPNGAAEAGIETYCLTPQGMASHLLREYEDDQTKAHANNQFDAENLLLACDLHRALLKKTGARDRGVRRARFMTVLREQNRPAVLLEGGYLSNPEEARAIGSAQYRQKLAEAVAEALGVTPPTLTSQAP